MSEVIWSDTRNGEAVTLDHVLAPEILSLFRATVWGSGSMRYRINELPAKLGQLRDPYVFAIRQGQDLMAACILDRCSKWVLERKFDAFHIVMLATVPDYRSKGFGKRLVERIREFCERHLKTPGVAYAYIEASTELSLRISADVRHSIEAELEPVLFTRLWPRIQMGVRLLGEAERQEVIDRLKALYAGHELQDFEASVSSRNYHVVQGSTGIMAGVQSEVLNWSVTRLPGLAGFLLMSTLPYLPHLKSVANPHNLRFVRFSNLLFEQARQGELARLFETVLAISNTAIGLVLMDRKSPVHARLLSEVPLGSFQKLLSASTKLHMDFVGVSENEISKIAERPVVVSAADVF